VPAGQCLTEQGKDLVTTVAIQARGMGHLVAVILGHATTLQSYARPGSEHHAQQSRAIELLGHNPTLRSRLTPQTSPRSTSRSRCTS